MSEEQKTQEQAPEEKPKRKPRKKKVEPSARWKHAIVLKGIGYVPQNTVVTDEHRKAFAASVAKGFDPKSGSDKPSIDDHIG